MKRRFGNGILLTALLLSNLAMADDEVNLDQVNSLQIRFVASNSIAEKEDDDKVVMLPSPSDRKPQSFNSRVSSVQTFDGDELTVKLIKINRKK